MLPMLKIDEFEIRSRSIPITTLFATERPPAVCNEPLLIVVASVSLFTVNAPVNVALRSEANVKIVSVILFKSVLLLDPAVADLNIIEPPSAVPLPAPPRNSKLPPVPVLSAPSPPNALPAVIVKALPL